MCSYIICTVEFTRTIHRAKRNLFLFFVFHRLVYEYIYRECIYFMREKIQRNKNVDDMENPTG